MEIGELDIKKKILHEDILKEDSYYYTHEALREAISQSEEDFLMGRVHTIEEIRAKFPKP